MGRTMQNISQEMMTELAGAVAVELAQRKNSRKTETTLHDFFRYYIENYAKIHTKTAADLEKHYRLYLIGWSTKRLHEIKRTDILGLQAHIAETKSKHAANRAVELLAVLYNKAIEWEMFEGKNPAARLRKFRLQSRERFLQADEIPRFLAAVKSLRYETTRDYYQMLLWTAQRRRNVCEMRWQDLDLDREVWYIPETKNGTSHYVPLVRQAMEILKRRLASTDKHPTWVFPRRDGNGPVWQLGMAWTAILKRAKIENLCIHDLRRTHASWQAIAGVSSIIIGGTLNHKDPKSTAVYARLNIDPVRDAMQQAVDAMTNAGAK